MILKQGKATKRRGWCPLSFTYPYVRTSYPHQIHTARPHKPMITKTTSLWSKYLEFKFYPNLHESLLPPISMSNFLITEFNLNLFLRHRKRLIDDSIMSPPKLLGYPSSLIWFSERMILRRELVYQYFIKLPTILPLQHSFLCQTENASLSQTGLATSGLLQSIPVIRLPVNLPIVLKWLRPSELLLDGESCWKGLSSWLVSDKSYAFYKKKYRKVPANRNVWQLFFSIFFYPAICWTIIYTQV